MSHICVIPLLGVGEDLEFYPAGWCFCCLIFGNLHKTTSQMIELKEKEITIASYAAKGWSVQQTAEAMHLSAETIKWYRKRMLKSVDATNIAELVAILKDEKIL